MIIEQEMLSMRDARETLDSIRTWLVRQGFRMVKAEPQRLLFRRGRKSARAAVQLQQRPMLVCVDYDRGRVAMAAGFQPPWKKHPDKQQIFLRGVLAGIAGVVDPQQAESGARQWDDAEYEVEEVDRGIRRRRGIFVGVIVLIILALAGLITWVVATH